MFAMGCYQYIHSVESHMCFLLLTNARNDEAKNNLLLHQLWQVQAVKKV